MKQTPVKKIFLGFIFSILTAGCQSVSSQVPSYSETPLLPAAKEEVRIGNAVDAFVQQNFILMADEELSRRIDNISKKLISSRGAGRLPTTIRILNHNDLNAFSAPGGYIYLTYGILKLAKSEGEVAAILAHEMAHVEKRHHMKTYRTVQSVEAILNTAAVGLNLAGMQNAGDVLQKSGPLGALIALNAFARYQENEADDHALYLLKQAGYPLQSLVSVLERVQQKKEESTLDRYTPTIFLTHPPTPERIKRIESKILEFQKERVDNIRIERLQPQPKG